MKTLQNHALTKFCFLSAPTSQRRKKVFASVEGASGEKFGDFASNAATAVNELDL